MGLLIEKLKLFDQSQKKTKGYTLLMEKNMKQV